MGRSKDSSISVIIDKGLKLKSWSEEFQQIWGQKAGKLENCFFYEILPLRKSTIDSVKRVSKDGKTVRLKEVNLPCPYGLCQIDMKIAPVDKKNLSLGTQISLEPTFACKKERHSDEYEDMEDIRSTITTLAHGLRNPLNAIKGAVVYIREKYAREKNLSQFTQIIEEEIARLEEFIAHYLSTAMVQQRGAATDINAVLKKIELLMSFQVKAHKIRSVYHFGSVPRIKVNPFLVEHAIMNVINNAIEAMSQGGQLTMATGSVHRSGKYYVAVQIADTGCGIMKSTPRDYLSHKKGRGFGLLITHEILRSVSGHLEILSGRGKGTVVKLFFPCE